MRAAAAAIALAVLAAPARADRLYLGVGFGPGADLDGGIDTHFDSSGEINGRVLLGLRRGDWALEGSFFGTDAHLAATDADATHSTLAFGAGLKRYVALTPYLELFVRGGIDYTYLVSCPGKPAIPPTGYSGAGLDYGVGLELGKRVAVPRPPPGAPRVYLDSVGASLWVDVGRQRFTLETEGGKPMTGRLAMVDIGFSFELGW